MYRGVALALGLLVTPAAAAELYTAFECETLEMLLVCEPHSNYQWRGMQGLRENHPGWAFSTTSKTGFSPIEDAFNALRVQICNDQVTPQDALHGYCPAPRTKP